MPAVAQIHLPRRNLNEDVSVRADRARSWREGNFDVYHLQGNCLIEQTPLSARGQQAVIRVRRSEPYSGVPSWVTVWLEGDVSLAHREDVAATDADSTGKTNGGVWSHTFYTSGTIGVQVATPHEPTVQSHDIYTRASAAWRGQAEPPPFGQQIQFNEPVVPNAAVPNAAVPNTAVPNAAVPNTVIPNAGIPSASAPPLARSIIMRSRSSTVPLQVASATDPQTGETTVTITSGANVVVDGIQGVSDFSVGRVDIEADRIVAWTSGIEGMISGQGGQQATQAQDVPLEFYMEGNIVFRESDRVIYADRMYYNVNQQYGMVLNAEMLSPIPGFDGLVRLKAEVLQQLNRFNFQAHGAAITTSRLGRPEYWVQSESVSFQDTPRTRIDPFTGEIAIDPQTGEPEVEHNYRVRSSDNFVYFMGVPVFYWPVLATNLKKSTFYVNDVRVGSDSVYGNQFGIGFDVFQIVGTDDPPDGVDWSLDFDWLSDRGFALGTDLEYRRPTTLFGIPTTSQGRLYAWGLDDSGQDNLGANRRNLIPEEDLRGRLLWQHRYDLANNFEVTAEVGLISDRNFLEQFYEAEWDTWKDRTTGIELKHVGESSSWSVTSDIRVNDWNTQTEWLPRFDHFVLGRSLLVDRFTWFAHTNVGLARLKTASLPQAGTGDPAQQHLPWETDTLGTTYGSRDGVRAATRHEIDMPLQFGPIKVVPYALGEVAYWQSDRDDSELTRLFGQVGVRSSLPLWSVEPAVQSTLFNLNGLAHKVSFESELFFADASEDMSRLPLYDPLDDDSQEAFLRRILPVELGGTIQPQFDSRLYALRSGLQSHVTSPSTEIADDLTVVRLGVHQRWQTRRGLPGQQRNVDVFQVDVDGVYFPRANRDNFGEDLGLITYDLRWFVGDRLTLLSDGFADFFGDGLRKFTAGAYMTRPGVGSLYFGYRSLEGPLTSNVLSSTINYRMSEKWVFDSSISYDLGPTGNIGETFSLIRVGESLLMVFGFSIDHSRGNFGVNVSVLPRFLSRGSVGRVGGVPIPPAGLYGLE